MDDELDCLVVVAIIGTLIGVIVYAAVAGVTSMKNFIVHGEWTTDTQSAEVRDHMNDPNYFAERAAKAQLSVINLRTEVTHNDPDHDQVEVHFNIQNASDDDHIFELSSPVVRIDGVSVTLNCTNYASLPELPAQHSTWELAFETCSDQTSPGHVGNAELVQPPAITKIDNLPVTGGPANTKWQ